MIQWFVFLNTQNRYMEIFILFWCNFNIFHIIGIMEWASSPSLHQFCLEGKVAPICLQTLKRSTLSWKPATTSLQGQESFTSLPCPTLQPTLSLTRYVPGGGFSLGCKVTDHNSYCSPLSLSSTTYTRLSVVHSYKDIIFTEAGLWIKIV